MAISKFYMPIRFIIGQGSFAQLGKETARLGKSALLVTGSRSMRSTGMLEKAAGDLAANGVAAVVFDKVEPNPRTSTIDTAAKIARDNRAKMVIALGGGSVMDASKCIALAAAGGEPIFSYYEGKANSKINALPIVAVPTVAASGSEANNGAVITNWETHEKVVLMHPSIYPAVSIVDPALTLTVPAKTTAQGGVDIFCHLVEAYVTAHEYTLINDSLRESSMRTVVEALPDVLARLDDVEGRSRLTWASTIACSQFSNLGGGTGLMTLHGLEHALSAIYDMAHGDGLAALLIEWMKFTLPSRRERIEKLGQNVFGASDGIEATQNWLHKVGMGKRLHALGVKEADLEVLADNALKTAPWVKFHPIALDKASIISIYKKSF
ncbi:MAG: iron-containing alcohol dehydrogenase [Dehalococcoidia bacterium]|nr:iron-containing alcohol dehydrogenase [Dehalococcoidia bacterium]MDD5647834.1 iron-containing alcohol dehydrogenase [Dehalococcoidia bacterium]